MSTRSGNQFVHDVAFANAFADLAVARHLAKRLGEDGLRVWVDVWDPTQQKTATPQDQPKTVIPQDQAKAVTPHAVERHDLLIQEKLQECRTQIVVMSKAAFANWPALEKQTRLFRDPANPGRQFIPLRLDNTPIPPTMANFAYIDWTERSELEYDRLLASCRSVGERNEDIRAPIYTLLPHQDQTIDLLMSADEKFVYSASRREIRTWKFTEGLKVSSIKTHFAAAASVVLLTDTTYAISDSSRARLEVWDMQAGVKREALKGKDGFFENFRLTSDRRQIVSVRPEGLTVMKVVSGKLEAITLECADLISFALSGNGERIVCVSKDGPLSIWDTQTGLRRDVESVSTTPTAIAVSYNGHSAVAGFSDGTVKLWDLEENRCLVTMEGHLGAITCLALTPDGHTAVSGSVDQTIKVWSLPTGSCIATIRGPGVGPVRLATIAKSGSRGVYITTDGRMSFWDVADLLSQEREESVGLRYTNAKVLLVGDTGVGKSSLAHRLTTGEFALTASTHGAWATQMKLSDHSQTSPETQREVWLWDFAGQSDYRLIHQLFFDETALAIFVFNPQSEDPFDGLGQWDRDITRSARRRFQKLLVAGRCDRGGLLVSKKALQAYPVLLVIRTSDGVIRWMNITAYLKSESAKGDKLAQVRQIVFKGELFNAVNLLRFRDELLEPRLLKSGE